MQHQPRRLFFRELNAQREQRDCADPYDQDHQSHRVVVEPMPALYTHDAPRPERPTHSSPGSPSIEGRRGFTSLLVAAEGLEVQKLAARTSSRGGERGGRAAVMGGCAREHNPLIRLTIFLVAAASATRRAAPPWAEMRHGRVRPRRRNAFCVPELRFQVWCDARSRSLHEPAMAHDQRLAGQRVAFEAGKEYRRFGDVLDRGEFSVHRVLQHYVLDDFGF